MPDVRASYKARPATACNQSSNQNPQANFNALASRLDLRESRGATIELSAVRRRAAVPQQALASGMHSASCFVRAKSITTWFWVQRIWNCAVAIWTDALSTLASSIACTLATENMAIRTGVLAACGLVHGRVWRALWSAAIKVRPVHLWATGSLQAAALRVRGALRHESTHLADFQRAIHSAMTIWTHALLVHACGVSLSAAGRKMACGTRVPAACLRCCCKHRHGQCHEARRHTAHRLRCWPAKRDWGLR